MWESVDNFKVNKWMLKLGAKWTVSEHAIKHGGIGFGDQWELNDMIVSQQDACKWYYAIHIHKLWWRIRNIYEQPNTIHKEGDKDEPY